MFRGMRTAHWRERTHRWRLCVPIPQHTGALGRRSKPPLSGHPFGLRPDGALMSVRRMVNALWTACWLSRPMAGSFARSVHPPALGAFLVPTGPPHFSWPGSNSDVTPKRTPRWVFRSTLAAQISKSAPASDANHAQNPRQCTVSRQRTLVKLASQFANLRCKSTTSAAVLKVRHKLLLHCFFIVFTPGGAGLDCVEPDALCPLCPAFQNQKLE